MYYIDEPVPIDKSFTEKPICAWHIAGRLTIDYINKNTTQKKHAHILKLK